MAAQFQPMFCSFVKNTHHHNNSTTRPNPVHNPIAIFGSAFVKSMCPIISTSRRCSHKLLTASIKKFFQVAIADAVDDPLFHVHEDSTCLYARIHYKLKKQAQGDVTYILTFKDEICAPTSSVKAVSIAGSGADPPVSPPSDACGAISSMLQKRLAIDSSNNLPCARWREYWQYFKSQALDERYLTRSGLLSIREKNSYGAMRGFDYSCMFVQGEVPKSASDLIPALSNL